MKRILAVTMILGLMALWQNKLMAQDDVSKFNKNQKISDQLKNGSAPGLRFGPNVQRKQVNSKPPAGVNEHFSERLKKGMGSNVAGGGGNGSARSSAFKKSAARTSSGNMTSDQKPVLSSSPAAAPAPKIDQGKEPALHYDAPKAPPKKQ